MSDETAAEATPKVEHKHDVMFDNGTLEVGAEIVKHNADGSVDLHAAEADSDDVKVFKGIHEGTGSNTYRLVRI